MAHTYLGKLVPMVLRMVVAAALMVGVTTVFLREWVTQGPSMLAPQKDIRDNDDAEDIVTVGMTAVEVKDRITKPEPSWTMFMLKEWVEDDSIRIPISRPSDDPLVLTIVEGDVRESPYYAWVFFSPHSRTWEPTFVYFQAREDTVIHVGRFDCNHSLAALALFSWEVASEY